MAEQLLSPGVFSGLLLEFAAFPISLAAPIFAEHSRRNKYSTHLFLADYYHCHHYFTGFFFSFNPFPFKERMPSFSFLPGCSHQISLNSLYSLV